MTLHLKNIRNSINKILSFINLIIYALLAIGSMWTVDLKKFKEKKFSLLVNILLLILLVSVLIVMTYGAYRRQTDYY